MKEFYIQDDGIRLHAKLEMPPETDEDNPGKLPLCIVIHGFTGNMEERHIIAAARAIRETGCATLRVEMYGHGKSSGEFKDHTLYKWVGNALAVVKYAKSLDFVTDLYMCGHSQGGLLVMLTAGMCRDDIKAIIPMSPAWMIPEQARKGTILGMNFDPDHIPDELRQGDLVLNSNYIRVAQTIHVEDEIARFPGDVLITQGDADESVPYEYALKAEKLYSHCKLVLISGDTHCYDYHLDQVEDAIKKFMTEEIEGGLPFEVHQP
ncbi:MAG: alpha/beta fold hydrolase [Eubacteriales bacterium]|jgi:alpha/beta superfamily hydrolase